MRVIKWERVQHNNSKKNGERERERERERDLLQMQVELLESKIIAIAKPKGA